MPLSEYVSVLIILAAEFCERLAAFGIASSLTLFLRSKLGYSIEQATVATAIWVSFATLFCLAGGYISDALIGRKKTILVGMIIYCLGLVTVSVITDLFDYDTSLHLDVVEIIFWLSLYSCAFGGGGIKANTGIFGVDQLYTTTMHDNNNNNFNNVNNAYVTITPPSAELIQSYWNWFYFIINAGALISFTVISYICQNISFAIGWSIPMVAMLLAIIIFCCRQSKFRDPQMMGDNSMINIFCAISWYSLRNLSKKQEIIDSLNDDNDDDGGGDDDEEYTDPNEITWLDVSRQRFGGEYNDQIVDEVKSVYSIFGFLPFMTMYWMVYAAMSSLFYSQGCQMNYMIGDFAFPISAINDANIVIILVLIPICDKLLYPWMRSTSWCFKFTLLRKMGLGYFILALSMLCAGFIEFERKQSTTLSTRSTCDNSVFISDLSLMWQIPQYLLTGISEVFASIVALEFFSGQAPESMKSIIYSINLAVMGLGTLLSSMLVVIVDSWKQEWIPNDLDNGYLDYYCYLIAGIMIVTLIVFIPFSSKYEYREGTDAFGDHIMDSQYKQISNKDDDEYMDDGTDTNDGIIIDTLDIDSSTIENNEM